LFQAVKAEMAILVRGHGGFCITFGVLWRAEITAFGGGEELAFSPPAHKGRQLACCS